ncbi:hypothetical protein MMC22_006661 [Lobaria immixta]|nr:hypothetical protein [Lobaria immixta]
MASRSCHQTVECKTIDGITLEAWFYPVERAVPAPAIIMTHGLNCVKDMSLAETAEGFQSAGYNVLLHDSRSVGGSGGFPRNQINPMQMAEDISDKLPSYGFYNRRSNLCGEATEHGSPPYHALGNVLRGNSSSRPDKRAKAFAQLIRDRESQLRGNEPFTLPPFNSKGENPVGFAGSGGPSGKEAYFLMMAAAERGHPNFRDRITLQSYHKMALFRPKEMMEEMLEGTPTMMMIPELDNISLPAEQKEVFEKLKTPKRLYWAEGKGHMSILSGEGSEKILEAMIEFFDLALKGEII